MAQSPRASRRRKPSTDNESPSVATRPARGATPVSAVKRRKLNSYQESKDQTAEDQDTELAEDADELAGQDGEPDHEAHDEPHAPTPADAPPVGSLRKPALKSQKPAKRLKGYDKISRKSNKVNNAKSATQEAEQEEQENGQGQSERDPFEFDEDEAAPVLPRRNRAKKSTSVADVNAEPHSQEDVENTPRRATQSKRKTSHFLDKVAEAREPELRGILTPSKNRTGRSRKSVAFEMDQTLLDENDLGFKDIPQTKESPVVTTPTKRGRGRPRKSPVVEEEVEPEDVVIGSGDEQEAEPPPPSKSKTQPKRKASTEAVEELETGEDESDDDVLCAMCGGADSEEPNMIILCDNCDLAVHQKCYKVPVIPEGDWLCKDCKIKTKRKANRKAKSEAVEEMEASEDESDDDVLCAICAGGDSEEPNEIILCDNCDLAVHQKCYKVPVIPEGDWLCGDCKPEDGDEQDEAEFGVEDVVMGSPPTENEMPDIEGFEEHFRVTQQLLLDKLSGRRLLKPCGLEDELQKVYQVIQQTVLAGEGNSMLVIGARGCGKSTLAETVLADLSKENRDNFHIVRLNGFIHTDDKLALREIWRQLGREMEVEDHAGGRPSNYSDTLASLLALLSHSSDDQSGQVAKSVIFILDEFDLFASHPRQTLLYNLFDIAQSSKAPIAVLGLTTRIDVVESLEKRVKSRFSHRYVHLSLPRNLPAFWDICREGLTVTAEELEEHESSDETEGREEFVEFWNSRIDDLYKSDDVFRNHLECHYYRTKSVADFFASCLLPIGLMKPFSLPLSASAFSHTPNMASGPDSKLHILEGLADLELALLISAARLDIVLDTDTCNFAMAYDEYCNLTSRLKIQTASTGVVALGAGVAKVWGPEVAMAAWERLVGVGLLIPASLGTGNVGRDAGKKGRMWRVDVGLEEIPGSVPGLGKGMERWCREI